MPVLVYCVLAATSQPEKPSTGVAGKAVQEFEHEGLRYWYSEIDGAAMENLDRKQEALAFHRVVQAAFQQVDVIPFRFAGAAGSLDDLKELQPKSYFHEELERLRGTVQMEVRVTPMIPEGPADSGTEYLRVRQSALHAASAAAATAKGAVADLTREWRQRGTRTGIRAYALVPRGAEQSFRLKVKEAAFENDVRLQVSGPWPPTEFLATPTAETLIGPDR